jgi:hypothetical protein
MCGVVKQREEIRGMGGRGRRVKGQKHLDK